MWEVTNISEIVRELLSNVKLIFYLLHQISPARFASFFVIGGRGEPKFILPARNRAVIGCASGEPPTWGRWNGRCTDADWTRPAAAAPSCALPHLASQVRIGPSNSSSYRPVRWEHALLAAPSRDPRLIESHAKRGMVGRGAVPKNSGRSVIRKIYARTVCIWGLVTRIRNVFAQFRDVASVSVRNCRCLEFKRTCQVQWRFFTLSDNPVSVPYFSISRTNYVVYMYLPTCNIFLFLYYKINITLNWFINVYDTTDTELTLHRCKVFMQI